MAEEEEKKEGKGFTVQDRRRFSETGDSRDDAGSSTDAVDSIETKVAEDSLVAEAKPTSNKGNCRRSISQRLSSALAHKRSCISARLPIR